jgi:hypothetical protein
VAHVKTTVEISDDLLRRAKRAARAAGKTLREVLEEGLRLALNNRARPSRKRFRMQTFGGGG